MELSKIAKITNVLLKLFLIIGIVLLFFVKKVVYMLDVPYQNYYTALFILIGIGCLYIVFEVSKVFKSIEDNNPFISENEIALKKIAVTCELIGILLFLKFILNAYVFFATTLILMIVFIIAGLCAYVFSQLFKQSAIIKEENDMTI